MNGCGSWAKFTLTADSEANPSTEGFTAQKTSGCYRFNMKITIDQRFTDKGDPYYHFEMFDGPDGIEHIRGYATSLETAFVKLIEWREKISAEYYAEETSTDNETN